MIMILIYIINKDWLKMTNVNVNEPFEPAEERAILQQNSLFHGLSEQTLDLVLIDRQVMFAPENLIIFNEGDAATSYYFVIDGQVAMFRYSLEGDERIFNIFKKSQTLAHAAMFMPHGRYPLSARAHQDSALFQLQRSSLQKACQQDGELATRFMNTISQRMYQQINELDWLSTSSAAQRLAYYLLSLEKNEDYQVQLPLTQRQLASHLSVRAETLSRLLADWLKQGVIEGRRQDWKLLNIPFLEDLAKGAKRSY